MSYTRKETMTLVNFHRKHRRPDPHTWIESGSDHWLYRDGLEIGFVMKTTWGDHYRIFKVIRIGNNMDAVPLDGRRTFAELGEAKDRLSELLKDYRIER